MCTIIPKRILGTRFSIYKGGRVVYEKSWYDLEFLIGGNILGPIWPMFINTTYHIWILLYFEFFIPMIIHPIVHNILSFKEELMIMTKILRFFGKDVGKRKSISDNGALWRIDWWSHFARKVHHWSLWVGYYLWSSWQVK